MAYSDRVARIQLLEKRVAEVEEVNQRANERIRELEEIILQRQWVTASAVQEFETSVNQGMTTLVNRLKAQGILKLEPTT